MVHLFAWLNIVYTENSLHCLVQTVADACKTNMDVIMDNYLVISIKLNFKDFILFIPLNVFNDIALCFDIFILSRDKQRNIYLK